MVGVSTSGLMGSQYGSMSELFHSANVKTSGVAELDPCGTGFDLFLKLARVAKIFEPSPPLLLLPPPAFGGLLRLRGIYFKQNYAFVYQNFRRRRRRRRKMVAPPPAETFVARRLASRK